MLIYFIAVAPHIEKAVSGHYLNLEEALRRCAWYNAHVPPHCWQVFSAEVVNVQVVTP